MADAGIPQPSPQLEYAPRDDEKSMALLAHVLQLIGAWLAPLIIYLVKRESKFVSFHALQALFLQLAVMGCGVVGVVGFFVVMFLSIPHMQHQQAPPAFLVLFPLIWLGVMGMWMLVLVTAIVYGIKAGRGEWANYPVLGGWARRVLNI